MEKVHCKWCNKKTDFADQPDFEVDASIYFCPSCLIPLLPTTLTLNGSPADQEVEGNERRRSRRYPLASRGYLTSSRSHNKFTKILLQDFSNSGMKIQAVDILENGEKVTLGFLSETLVYKAKGIIRHLSTLEFNQQLRYQAGVEIIAIHQELRD